jgi:hypothetical protein
MRTTAVSVCVLLACAPCPVHADVTGKWAASGPLGNPTTIDVVQSGSSLTMAIGLLLSGSVGANGFFRRGKGPLLAARPLGLPVTPVPVPLAAQVVGEGGTCVEARFEAVAVRTNRPGKLKAKLP